MSAQRTLLSIRIKQTEKAKFDFLQQKPEHDYFILLAPDIHGYIQIDYYYNRHLGFWERRKTKSAIKKRGGRIIDFTSLYPAPPRFSPKTKKMLIDIGLYFAVSYLPSLFGFPFILSPKLELNMAFLQAAQLAFIPSLFVVFARIIEYRRRQSD